MIVRTVPSPRTFPLDRGVDRMFDQIARNWFEPARPASPVVDGRFVDDAYVLTVDLPGVPASAVEIDVAGRVLSLSARTDSFEWAHRVRIGSRLDPEQVTARHVDGRLTVRIEALAEPEARKIEIDTNPVAEIEASAEETTAPADHPDHDSDHDAQTESTSHE